MMSVENQAAQNIPTVPFITRLRIRDFRSIAECDVALGPLTVLVGPNAAGKSNFLDAIEFVTHAVATSLVEAVSMRGGLDSLLHRPGTGPPAASFQILLESADRAEYLLDIGKDSGGRLVVRREEYRAGSGSGLDLIREVNGPARFGTKMEIGVSPDQLAFPIVGSQLRPPPPMFERLKAARFYDLDTAALRALDETLPESRGDTASAPVRMVRRLSLLSMSTSRGWSTFNRVAVSDRNGRLTIRP